MTMAAFPGGEERSASLLGYGAGYLADTVRNCGAYKPIDCVMPRYLLRSYHSSVPYRGFVVLYTHKTVIK